MLVRIIQDVRETLILALPLIVSQLAGIGQNTAVVALAGHLDAAVLGAIAIGEAVWAIVFLAALGLSNALPIVVSNLDGAQRRSETGAIFASALVLAAVSGSLLAVATWVAAPSALSLLRLDPALQRAAVSFLRTMVLQAPALTLFLACRGLSDGLGRPGPGMVASLLALTALVPLLVGTLFGRFGLPALGASGVGAASAFVVWLELAGMAAWLRWSGRYRGIGPFRPSLVGLLQLLRLGVPITASILMEASLFSVAGAAIGTFGAVAASAHAVALNITATTFMVPLGLSTAVTVRVGRAAGRGDALGARRAGLIGMGIALAFECISGVSLLTLPSPAAGLFTTDPALIAAATPLLRLAGAFQLADGLQVVSAAGLRGLRDVGVPTLMTAAAYWGIGLPVSLGLAFGAGWQAEGMWTGMVAGLFAAAVLLSTRFVIVSGRTAA